MQQAWHIFKKDFRHLWREVCLVVVLAVMFAWSAISAWKDPWWVEMLLTIAASYLVVRLIHAEAIPGDNQFWITRPYRWKSLLGAKALFILACVQLPIFVAQWVILTVNRFPFESSWRGLLWTQMLFILGVWFPIAALGAVTAGTTGVMISALILATVAFGLHGMLIPLGRQWPSGVEWVLDFIMVSVLVSMTLAILYMQYRNRRTLFSRIVAVGGIVLGAAAYWSTPWSLAWALQSRLPKPPFDSSSLRVGLDPPPKRPFDLPIGQKSVQMDLGIAVSGVADGVEVLMDALAVTFQGRDGRTWSRDLVGFSGRVKGAGGATFDRAITMDSSFFKQERDQPVTLRASVYLTLFGNARAKSILLEDAPVNVMDGLQCYNAVFDEMRCRAAFRWPSLLVFAKIQSNVNILAQFISYSPFPAGMSLNGTEASLTAGPPPSDRHVTIIVKEPLAHLRREFEVRGVRLADFAGAAR